MMGKPYKTESPPAIDGAPPAIALDVGSAPSVARGSSRRVYALRTHHPDAPGASVLPVADLWVELATHRNHVVLTAADGTTVLEETWQS
jgi:hypothetical protein